MTKGSHSPQYPESTPRYGGFSEDAAIEVPAIELFQSLGWSHANLYHEIFGPGGTEGRASMREAVLPNRLWAALQKLNPHLPPEVLRDAASDITRDRSAMLATDPESVPNIEQAREIIEGRDRRARERKEAHDEARIEAGYSHGDDYVSQSRAALRDHGRRLRAAQETTVQPSNSDPAPNAKEPEQADRREMADARRRRLDRLAAASKAVDRSRDRTEDDPDRPRGAPGGGHSRSR